MKKTILSIAIVIGGLVGSSAINAQNTAADPAAKETSAPKGMIAPKAFNPFEGLNLSEKQLTDLKALSDAQREQRMKERSEAKNGERQNPADRAAALQQERKDNLNKIKAILSPEQYVQFLENCYLNPTSQRMGGQDGRGMGRGRQGQRPDGGERGGRQGGRGMNR